MYKILLFTFIAVIVIPAEAQIRIVKRHHLPGYHITFGSKPKIKKDKAEKIRQISFVQGKSDLTNKADSALTLTLDHNNDTISMSTADRSGASNELPLVEHSALISTGIGVISVAPEGKVRSVNTELMSVAESFFIPYGAGMVRRNAYVVGERQFGVLEFFAFGSIVLNAVAILGLLLSIVPSLWFLGNLLLLTLPAIVFGIIGLYSSKRRLAKIGIYSSLVILIGLGIAVIVSLLIAL